MNRMKRGSGGSTHRTRDAREALAAKGEENRELIRAKIELMRKQLEITRSGSNLQFN